MRILISLAMLMAILITGCRHEEPNPELIDPIYSDLNKDYLGISAAREESEKNLEGFKKDLEKAPARTLEKRNAEEDIQKEQNRLDRLTQLEEYFKIRVERRKVEARRDYKLAFIDNKNWPDPKEYEAYMVNKHLVHASKNWNDRVPKLSTANPADEAPEKPVAAPGEGDAAAEAGPSSAHAATKEGIHHN
jgi:hypothetical protein